MGAIQGAINSMLGTAAAGASIAKGLNKITEPKQPEVKTEGKAKYNAPTVSVYKEVAQKAMQNAQNQVEFKKQQSNAFKNMKATRKKLGGKR